MNIAILGAGPAGLLATHACVRNGHQPTIYSAPADEHDLLASPVAKSLHGGAQYLHQPVPGINSKHDPDMILLYVKVGSRAGYAEKVYGDPEAPVSWDLFPEGLVPAWSMDRAYDELWREYENLMRPMTVDADVVDDLLEHHQLVINTVPLNRVCRCPDEHGFTQQQIILTPDSKCEARNIIVYNGQHSESWYRTSNIGGYEWTEYAAHADGPPIVGERHYGFKPIGNSCTCHPLMPRLGRFGRWSKGVLSHMAYDDMMHVLAHRGGLIGAQG